MSKQRIHFVVEDARIRRSFKEEKTYRLRRDERVRVAEEGIRRDSVGHFFARVVRGPLLPFVTHALKFVAAFFERVQKAPSFSLFVNDSEKREIFTTLARNDNDDSLLLPVANGVRRSELLIYARKCFLVTIFTAFVLSARYLYVYSSQRMVFAACSRVDFLFFLWVSRGSARICGSQSNLGL